MRLAAIALLTTACTEPIVEMRLVLPQDADRFDTSCLTAVEVRAMGASYLQNRDDYTRSCIGVTNQSTLTTIRDDIRGKFTLDIPDTGLSGISVFGWSGPTACEQTDAAPFTPDLVFFARGDHMGQDAVDVEATLNLNCASRKTMKVRTVDMFALIASGSSAGCTAAMTYPDMMGWGGTATLLPRLFGKGVDYYGGLSWATGTASLVTYDAMTEVGPKSCLALDGANAVGGSTGCAIAGAVCADTTTGEVEIAAVHGQIIQATTNFDVSLISKFPSVIYGSVWSNGALKMPIASATVIVDAAHARVIYVDPPDAGSGTVKVRADQSGTGTSGLFVVFADTLINAKIDGGGKTRTVTLGAPDGAVAGAMIVMQ